LLTVARVGSRRLVMAVDARAAGLGLHAGMAVAHAQAMVPDLRIEDAAPAEDEAALGRLSAWCLRHFSPLAAACAPDGIWIDVTGCAHLFAGDGEDGEASLLRALTGRLAEAGIASRAAIAATPGAAWALARYAPDALSIVAEGGTHAALAGLPVASLRLPEEIVRALRTLGLDSVGQLMAAPRAPLAKRFGRAVLERLDQATGAVSEPIRPDAAPGLLRTRMGFPEPIATPEDLARATGLLAERLCEKLVKQGLGASRLDLVFHRVDGAAQAICIGTAAATREAAHLIRLLTAQLETIDPGFGIEAMMLAAPLTARLDARQGLSELCAPAGAPDLSGLIDTLANRLGADRVFRAAPVESDVPERSVRAVPPLARAEGGGWPDRLPRPPRLFTPPFHIEAMALLPDHAPAAFTWRRRSHRVRRADGPERIFGEWWKDAGETWSVRDYFAVEDEAGQRFWLFRRGDGERAETGDLQWFLHGVFA
jgi:protein ImuB